MSRNQVRDEINDLREWADHQYNPPYWINRFDPYFPPKASWRVWLIAFIQFAFMLPALILTIYVLFTEGFHDMGMYVLLSSLSFAVIALTIFLINYMPKKTKPPQTKMEKWNQEKNAEEKTHPKRRKDYS